MIFDSHIHTKFSTDSTMSIEDVLLTARKNNIGIVVTEHIDLDYPIQDKFRCDIPKYFKEYEKYKGKDFGIGIEIGLGIDILDENENLAKNNNFDFILGSIHTVDKIDIYSEYSKITNLSKKEYFNKYLEYMLKCVTITNNFDSLSHIDYLSRYAPFKNTELILSEHKDIIAEIFLTLLNKGKVIELNSARLNGLSSQKALLDIISLYKDLGGKYLTIGSDAHTPNAISRNFKTALEILENLNLKGVYFKERKINIFDR